MAEKKHLTRNRIITLVIVYMMAIIWAFAILASNESLKTGTPRVIMLSCMIGVSVVYWVVFLVLIRRSNQKNNSSGE